METIVEYAIGKILEKIPSIFDHLFAMLSTLIYGLISIFYDVLTAIPKIDLLQKIDMEGIYQRCTMIITIIMAFYITFEVVKYVVQPDSINDKSKGAGNIVLRMVVVIILIAFVPTIFSYAYKLQARIIDSQVISKIILDEGNEGSNSLGSEFAANTFSVFYQLNTDVCNEDTNGVLISTKCELAKSIVEQNLNMIRTGSLTGAFALVTKNGVNTMMLMEGLDLVGPTTKTYDSFEPYQPIIKFNGFFAVAVGIYITWTLIVYGTEVAKRYFQLIFLQITAPIAIMSYLSPKKDGAFSKWLRQCITTYLDLFIRLVILNFIVLIINTLHKSLFSGGSLVQSVFEVWGINANLAVLGWVYVLLLIGLLQFIKKAPKLLKELLPSGNAASGEFGMSGKETIGTVKGIVTGTSRTIGGFAGGIVGAKTALKSEHLKGGDKIWSTMKATFNGAKTGFSKGGNIKKANEAGRSSVYKDEDIVIAGGTVIGAQFQGNKYAQEAQQYARLNKKDEEIAKVKDDANKVYKGTKVSKFIDSRISELEERKIGDANSRGAYLKSIEKTYNQYAYDRDSNKARTKIMSDAKTFYDSARSEIDKKAYAQTAAINEGLAREQLKYYNTEAVIKSYANVTGPLTQTQQAELDRAVQDKNTIEQRIDTMKAALTQEEKTRLREIEEERISQRIEMDEAETADIQAQLDKLKEDPGEKDQMRAIFEDGYVTSSGIDHKYTDDDGTEHTIHIMSAEEEEAEARRRGITREEVHKEQMAIYIAKIGDIQMSANTRIQNRNVDPQVRRARANAEASGKSGK